MTASAPCSFDREDLPVLLSLMNAAPDVFPPLELQPILLEKFFELALVLARFAPCFAFR